MSMYHHVNSDSSDDCVPKFPDQETGAGGSAGGSGLTPEMFSRDKPPLTNRGALITLASSFTG